MACDDCSECLKRDICTQPSMYDCVFRQVEENLQYLDILKEIKQKLNECQQLIVNSRKDKWDLEDYENKLNYIISEIEDATNEDIIKEYNELFKMD